MTMYHSGCGMGYEATMYLLERGVRLTGIDGLELGCTHSVHTQKKFESSHEFELDLGGA
jgi:kynurenine formamidase